MKKSTAWAIVVVIIVIIIGIVAWHYNMTSQNGAVPVGFQPGGPMIPANSPSGTEMMPMGATSTAMATGTQNVIVLNTTTNTKLGTFLVAANGMTLYTYGKDTTGVSNCTGACAAAWPPYTVTLPEFLKGGAGVSGAISTITRADGSTQVIYKGTPLYFWQGDTKVGSATGQNVNGFSVAKP